MKTILFLTIYFFYRQKKGLPMGSPIADILEEMKLKKLEEQIKIKYRDEIKYWFRYIDDIFTVLNKNIECPNVRMRFGENFR